jgi:perosamine synthetase
MTWPNYSPACIRAVTGLLKKGGSLSAYRANPLFPSWTGPLEGSYAEKLEREIERRFKVKHAVAVNSGTAGLHTALVAAGITSGEVITSPYTFSATVSAIVLAGATPVFADVDSHSFTITPSTVKGLVNKRTRCILPVDIFGGLAPFEGLDYDGIPIIRDSCQAVGAVRNGTYSGGDALAAAYSFNGGKQVPAGEAGALVTNDSKLAERARLFMNHGENFHQKEVGVNYRPNELTCAVAYHGLMELEERNQKRRDLVKELLIEGAGDIFSGYAELPWSRMSAPFFDARYSPEDGSHVFYVVPLRLSRAFGSRIVSVDRELFIHRMKKRGIPVGAGYITPPLHKYPAFRKYARGPLPVVEELSSKTLCILSTLTPDRPLSYAREVAKAMRESLS